jgi:hypothetical protein
MSTIEKRIEALENLRKNKSFSALAEVMVSISSKSIQEIETKYPTLNELMAALGEALPN